MKRVSALWLSVPVFMMICTRPAYADLIYYDTPDNKSFFIVTVLVAATIALVFIIFRKALIMLINKLLKKKTYEEYEKDINP